jgi:hypothetical protein
MGAHDGAGMVLTMNRNGCSRWAGIRTNIGLSALTVSEWYANLENEALEEVKKFWREINFRP